MIHPDKTPAEIRQKRKAAPDRSAQMALRALHGYQEQRSEGVPYQEAMDDLKSRLRAFWPRPEDASDRDQPWRYDCDACKDSALEPVQTAEPVYGGEYRTRVRPCTQCVKGQALRDGWAGVGVGDASVDRAVKRMSGGRRGR